MRKAPPPPEYHLVSVTSILIFSSFLIGMAVGNVLGSELEPYVLACGLSGFLAFIGLELAAFRRKMLALEEEKRNIEHRLDRHVLSQSNVGFVTNSRPETSPVAVHESAGAA